MKSDLAVTKLIDWGAIKKIVVLNYITTTVGDSLYLLPLIQKLKKEVPQARITLTGSGVTRELLQHDHSINTYVQIPNIEEIGTSKSKIYKIFFFLSTLFRTYKLLKKIKPDIAIILLPNQPIYQLIPLLARVPITAGYTYNKSIFARYLTYRTPYRSPDTTKDATVHISQAYMDILNAMNIQTTYNDTLLRRTVTQEEQQKAKEFLATLPIRKPLIVFQAGAKYKDRQWPPERYAEVGRQLIKKYRASILLAGSPSEKELCEHIKQLIGAHSYNIAGAVSLGTLAGIFAQANIVIGNDSGLMHYAAGVRTQTISIFGHPHPSHSKPLGKKPSIIIKSPRWHEKARFEYSPNNIVSKYLLDITPDVVMKACDKILRLKISQK